jgi:DhnA family fructose-bisphosphate aldolase class Ia
MNGIDYRLKEFINPSDGHSMIVDTSAGAALGALPGLEDFEYGIQKFMHLVDGIVCNSGQARRLKQSNKDLSAILLRADWTNTLRDEQFVLPVQSPRLVQLLDAQDASDFGVSAMVLSFLLGYSEEIEGACMKATVNTGIEGRARGIPLIVEVRPTGPRVSLPGKAVELGASYALEGGADVIVVPYPGKSSLDTIAQFVSVPWLIKPTSIEKAHSEIVQAMSIGCRGLWLDYTQFEAFDPTATLESFRRELHQVRLEA